jgi:hypothetical protein
MLALRDAEHLGWRFHTELNSLPLPADETARQRDTIETLLRMIMKQHPRLPGEEGIEGLPSPGWGTARLRTVALAYETEAAQRQPRAGGPSVEELCEGNVRDHLIWQLGQDATIASEEVDSPKLETESPAERARIARAVMIFPNLVDQLVALTDIRVRRDDLLGAEEASALAADVAREPAGIEKWRIAAREGGLADPKATLARTLVARAGTLWAIHDPESIANAETALTEAAGIANDLVDEGRLRALICRSQAVMCLESHSGRKR